MDYIKGNENSVIIYSVLHAVILFIYFHWNTQECLKSLFFIQKPKHGHNSMHIHSPKKKKKIWLNYLFKM